MAAMMNKTEREKEQILRISGVNPRKCMRCGKCSGTCPSYDEMEYHPHQFVYMVESGDIETLKNSPSIYKCLSCFACVDRCPRGVEPAKLIEALRLSVIREKGANHMTANDIPQLLDDEMPQQAIVSAMRKYSK
jgi:heterodisulfide reductase subunit C